jgi:hypothetical protein
MSAEAAIYPTPKPVSNRFFQNFLTFSAGPARRPSAEPAAFREVTGASQATFSRKKLNSSGKKYLETLASNSAFLRSAASIETEIPGQPIFSFLLFLSGNTELKRKKPLARQRSAASSKRFD